MGQLFIIDKWTNVTAGRIRFHINYAPVSCLGLSFCRRAGQGSATSSTVGDDIGRFERATDHQRFSINSGMEEKNSRVFIYTSRCGTIALQTRYFFNDRKFRTTKRALEIVLAGHSETGVAEPWSTWIIRFSRPRLYGPDFLLCMYYACI